MLSRKALLIFGNKVLGIGLGYLALIVIGRYFPPADYGLIGFGLAFIGLLSFLGNLGYNSAHIKRISEGQPLARALGTYFTVKAVLVALFFAVAGIYLGLRTWVPGWGFSDARLGPVLMLITAYFGLFHIRAAISYTFIAQRNVARQEVGNLLENLIRILGTILVAFFGWGVVWFAASYAIAASVALLFMLAMFLRERYTIAAPDLEMFWLYTRFAAPAWLVVSISYLSLYTDRIMIEWFWGAAEVGYYFMAQGISMIPIMAGTAAALLILPLVSAAAAKGDHGEVRSLVLFAERHLLMLLVPGVVILMIFPSEVLQMIGVGYLPAATPLRLIALYALFNGLYIIFAYQLNGIDRRWPVAALAAGIALVNITLNLILIPKWGFGLGATGAAIAIVTSQGLGLIGVRMLSMHYAKTPWQVTNLRMIVAGGIMALVLIGMGMIHLPDRVWWLGIYSILGGLVYLGSLVMFREFGRRELSYFRALGSPKGLMNTIRKDLRRGDG